MSQAKPVDPLTPKDWEKHPVWAFDLDNEGKPGRDETWMVPVKKLPATDIQNGGCRANATLACGQPVMLVLWGVNLDPEEKLRILAEYRVKPMTAAERAEELKPKIPRYTLFVNDRWWHSKRNGLFMSMGDYKQHTPADLAVEFRLTLKDIFPIAYDISAFAVGIDHAIRGELPLPKPAK